MPLFRSSPKNPQELVKALRDTLQVLSTTEGSSRKAEKVRLPSQNSIHIHLPPPHTHLTTLIPQAADEAAKHLVSMKTMLYGTDTQEPQTELAAQLAQEFYNHDMLLHLAKNLHKLEFEVS